MRIASSQPRLATTKDIVQGPPINWLGCVAIPESLLHCYPRVIAVLLLQIRSCLYTYGNVLQLPLNIPERSHSDHELNYLNPDNAFDPNEDGPYFVTRELFVHIHELLSITDQVQAAGWKHGPQIWFPKQSVRTTWSELRKIMPYTIKGCIEQFDHDANPPSMKETLEDLNITGGITQMDQQWIVHALQTKSNLRRLYK